MRHTSADRSAMPSVMPVMSLASTQILLSHNGTHDGFRSYNNYLEGLTEALKQ